MDVNVAKAKYQFDIRIFIMGVISFAGFLYASSYAHEWGHIAVCHLYGFRSELHVSMYTLDTRSTTCFGEPANSLLFWSAGGLAGTTASLVPVPFFKKYKFLIAGCIPNTVANVIAGIMETFAHEWYISTQGTASIVATVPMLGVGTYLLLKYSLTYPTA